MPFMSAHSPTPLPVTRPADPLRRGLQALGHAEVVHHLARREAVAVAQHVLQTELERIPAELRGQQVDALLGGPGRLRGGIAAEGAVARPVGVHAVAFDLDVVEAIRPDRRPAALGGDVRAGVGIGAGVPLRPHAPGHEAPVARRPEADARARRMPVEREEELIAREHELDRSPGLARQRRRDRLDAGERLGAEGAAHRQRDDADVALGEAERPGQLAADVERRLRAGPDREAAVLPVGDAAVRLERRVLGRGRRPLAFDDHLGLVEPRLAAAADEPRAVRDVGARQGAHAAPRPGAPGDLAHVVDERRAVRQRGLQVGDGRQIVPGHLDRPGEARRLSRIGRGDRGDRIADVARDRRQHRRVGHEAAVERAVGDIGRRQQHAAGGKGAGQRHLRDGSVRAEGAHDPRVQHSRQLEVDAVVDRAGDAAVHATASSARRTSTRVTRRR